MDPIPIQRDPRIPADLQQWVPVVHCHVQQWDPPIVVEELLPEWRLAEKLAEARQQRDREGKPPAAILEEWP
jgi:hypothetical protein